MDSERKVAVLFDAENIASKYTPVILNEANALGSVIIRRIYGDWTAREMSSWKQVILDHSIQPIQQYRNVSGKNSSDSALIIDAMDLLYQGRVDAFCIVSSDSDFTRLAARLRESEKFVLGLGEQKTPQSFISACSKFAYLDLLYEAAQPEKSEKTEKKAKSKGKNQKKAAQPAEKAPVPESRAGSDLAVVRETLLKLAELLTRKLPDFDVRNFRYKKFVQFVESLQLFETKRQAAEGELVHTIYFRVKA